MSDVSLPIVCHPCAGRNLNFTLSPLADARVYLSIRTKFRVHLNQIDHIADWSTHFGEPIKYWFRFIDFSQKMFNGNFFTVPLGGSFAMGYD